MTGPDDRTGTNTPPVGTNTPPVVSPGGGDGTEQHRAELVARLERLADRYEVNHLPDQARGVRHALREVRAYFAPVELRAPTTKEQQP